VAQGVDPEFKPQYHQKKKKICIHTHTHTHTHTHIDRCNVMKLFFLRFVLF
jgi:hypothetical protein